MAGIIVLFSATEDISSSLFWQKGGNFTKEAISFNW